MKECAVLLIESIEEYEPLRHPDFPQKLKDWENLPQYQKDKTPTTFWHEPEIFNFLEKRQSIIFQNRSNFIWLNKWLSYVQEEHKPKVVEKINKYKTFFEFNPNKFYNFFKEQKENTMKQDQQEMQEVLEQFDGKIIE